MDPVLLHPIYVKKGGIKCGCITGDGKYAAAGASNGQVLLFPLDKSLTAQRLTGHVDAVTCICAAEASLLISGSEDGTVRFWKDSASRMIEPNDGPIRTISVAAAEPLILVVGSNGRPSIWNARTLELVIYLRRQQSEPKCGAISPDGIFCVLGYSDRNCKVFDTRNGTQIRGFKAGDEVSSLAICAHHPYIVAGCIDGSVTLYNYREHEVLAESLLHSGSVNSLSFHPYLNCLATGSVDKKILLVKVPDLITVYTLTGHTGPIFSVSWGAEGDKFVSAADDRGVFVWSAPDDDVFADEEEEDVEVIEAADEEFQEAVTVSYEVKKDEPIVSAPIPEVSAKRKDIGVMESILEKMKDLSSIISAMEGRMNSIDGKIEQLERAQVNGERFVSRSVRK
jgi:centriolar protein POC1